MIKFFLFFIFLLSVSFCYTQTLTVDSVFQSTCSSNGRVYFGVSGGTPTYQYRLTAGPVSYPGGFPTLTQPSNVFSSLPTGSYTAEVIDNIGGVGTVGFSIGGNYQSSFLILDSLSDGNCPNTSSIHYRDTLGLAPYEYRVRHQDSISFTPWQSTGNFTNVAEGIYTLQGRDACGELRSLLGQFVPGKPFPQFYTSTAPVQSTLQLIPTSCSMGVIGVMITYNSADTRLPFSSYQSSPSVIDTSFRSDTLRDASMPVTYTLTGSNGYNATQINDSKFYNTPRNGIYTLVATDACGSSDTLMLSADIRPLRPGKIRRYLSNCGLDFDRLQEDGNQTDIVSLPNSGYTVNGTPPYTWDIVSGNPGAGNTSITAYGINNFLIGKFPGIDSLDHQGDYVVRTQDACGQVVYDTIPELNLRNLLPTTTYEANSEICPGPIESIIFNSPSPPPTETITYRMYNLTDNTGPTIFHGTAGFFNGEVNKTYLFEKEGDCSGIIYRDTVTFRDVYSDLTANVISYCNGTAAAEITRTKIDNGWPFGTRNGASILGLFLGVFNPSNSYTSLNVIQTIGGLTEFGGVNPATFNNLNSGTTYTVIFRNSGNSNYLSGCYNYITFTVPPYQNPELINISYDPICSPATTGNIYAQTINGQAPYQYRIRTSFPVGTWSPWQDSSTFVNMPANSYDIEIVDTCLNSTIKSITTGMLLPPVLFTNSPVCLGSQLEVRAVPNLLSAGVTYTWTHNSASLPHTTPLIRIPNAQLSDSGIYEVTINYPGCSPQLANVDAKVIANIDSAIADAIPQLTCEGDTVNLLGSNSGALITSGQWTVLSGPANATATPLINDDTLNNTYATGIFTTDGPPSIPWIFQWSVNNGVCWTNDSIEVYSFREPANIRAGFDQTVCNSIGATLDADSVLFGRGAWTQISGPSSISFTDSTDPKTSITGLVTNPPSSTYVLRWTVYNDSLNGTCSNFDEVSITTYQPTTVPSAGPDSVLCEVLTYNMQGVSVSPWAGYWRIYKRPLNVIVPTIVSPTSPITSITFNGGGAYGFIWTASNGVCPSLEDTVEITVVSANAGFDRLSCISDIPSGVQLSADSIAGFPGVWTQISGSDPLVFTPNGVPGSDTAIVTGFTQQDTSLVEWSITSGSCILRDTISIAILGEPTIANAGVDQLGVCSPVFTLQGNTPAIGSGSWSQFNGPSIVSFSNFDSVITDVTNLVLGSYEFLWTIENNPCSNSVDTVMVQVVNPSPVQCNDTTIYLNASGGFTIDTSFVYTPNTCSVDSVWLGQSNFTCSDTGVNSITVYVEYSIGVLDSCTSIVTVLDTVPSSVLCIADIDTIISNENCELVIPDFSSRINLVDNCNSTYTYSQVPLQGTFYDVSDSITIPVTVFFNDASNIIDSCEFNITANCDNIELIIPQFISPNSDGKNDTWDITGLNNYPNNNVKVFNRWGNLVFEQNGYSSGWGGDISVSGGLTINRNVNVLPSGTYFYLVDLGGDFDKVYTGYLQIQE